MVFVKTALAFVDAHAAGAAQRGAAVFGQQSLLVDAVPRFVHGGEKRIQRVFKMESGSNADIAGIDAVGEGMLGNIEPPGVVIEPQRGGNLLTESPLFFDIKRRTLKQIPGRFVFGGFQFSEEGNHRGFELREQGIALHRGQAFFELIQQRIIRILRPAEIAGFFATGINNFPQVGGEECVIALPFSFLPDIERFAVEPGRPDHKFIRQFDAPVVFATPFTDISSFAGRKFASLRNF